MKVKWVLFFVGLVGLDFVSKLWAFKYLPAVSWNLGYPFGGVGVFSFGNITCSLNFVTNTGAAWGLFANFPKLLFCVRFVVIGALLFFLVLHHGKNLRSLPLYLIISGAVGNVVDYLLHGYVVDFLHFTFWNWSFPIFNFADAYISVGAALLFWSLHKQSIAVKA